METLCYQLRNQMGVRCLLALNLIQIKANSVFLEMKEVNNSFTLLQLKPNFQDFHSIHSKTSSGKLKSTNVKF